MSKNTESTRPRGRPITGRNSYTIRMKPETKKILEATWGPIGPHLDAQAEKLRDLLS